MATKTTTKKTTIAKKASSAKAATKKATPKKKASPKATSGNGNAKAKKLSAIDAAAKVLMDTKQAMTCKELIEAMAAKKLWTSPGGKTPSATLYSALTREINTKGSDSRFKKTERGKFAANA